MAYTIQEDDLIHKAVAYYNEASKAMIGVDSAQTKSLAAVKAQFDTFGLSNEEMAKILSEMAAQTSVSFNKDALSLSIQLIAEEHKLPTIEAQRLLIVAQTATESSNKLNVEAQTVTEGSKSSDIISTTTVRNAQSAKDLLVKAEQILASTSNRALTDSKKLTEEEVRNDVIAGTAVKYQSELAEKIKNGNVLITYTYYVDGVSGTTATTTVLNNVIGEVISVTYGDGSSLSTHDASKDLIIKQKLTEINKATDVSASASLKVSQTTTETSKQALITRQKDGFSDNIHVKNVEFQSNLASFAVNSGSDTASAAITKLGTDMAALIARAV